MVRVPAALIALLASVVLACAPAPVTTPAATLTPSAPAAFPTTTGEVLVPGRYDSRPPFNIPFTFEAPAGGWESMHIHGEFFDFGRFEGEERQTAPVRWIAFGDPEHVRGREDIPDSDLTPAEAAGLLAERDDLMAGEPVPFSLDGRDGVRLDLHATEPNTPIFGGPEGDFGLEPSVDVRLGFVPVDEGLLVVFVAAPADELDAAWEEAQPVLESVDL
jgi:hypothetical protein